MKNFILLLSVLFFIGCKKENMYNIQKYVTPNNDNIEDVFELPFIGAEVIVFQRNGETVYHSTDYQNNWSGLGYSDVYYYTIKYNGKTIKGSVIVID